MAERLNAEWWVAYVETPAQLRLPPEARDRVVQTLRLAESLGAKTVTLTGTRMSDEILAFARQRNVTRIVVGKPQRSLWKRIVLGSIVDALVQGSGDIDIAVISGDREAPAAASTRRPLPRPADWVGYAQAVAASDLATAVRAEVSVFELSTHHGTSRDLTVAGARRGPRARSLSAWPPSIPVVPPDFTFAVYDARSTVTSGLLVVRRHRAEHPHRSRRQRRERESARRALG